MRHGWLRPIVFFGILSITALLLRPSSIFQMQGSIDGPCYAEFVFRALHLPYDKCFSDSYFLGVSVFWLSAGILATFFHSLNLGELEPLFYTIVGFMTLALAGIVIVQIRRIQKETSFTSGRAFFPFLFFFSCPALYYFFSRTTLAHAFELFVSLAFVRAMISSAIRPALFWASLLGLVRPNNLIVAPLLLFFFRQHLFTTSSTMILSLVGGGLSVVTGLLFAFRFGYHGMFFSDVISFVSIERFRFVFFGDDWGLVASNPFFVLHLGLGLLFFKRLSAGARLATVWMAFEILLCATWTGNGSDYSYRYLVGCFAGSLLVSRDLFVCFGIFYSRVNQVILGLSALINTVLTVSYRLSPASTPSPSLAGWGLTVPGYLGYAFRRVFTLDQWSKIWNASPMGSFADTEQYDLHAIWITLCFVFLVYWSTISIWALRDIEKQAEAR